METFRQHERTGRALGSDAFVQKLEQKFDGILKPQKLGQKAKPKLNFGTVPGFKTDEKNI